MASAMAIEPSSPVAPHEVVEDEGLLAEISREIHRVFLRDLDLVGHNIDSFDQGMDHIFRYFEGREWHHTPMQKDPLVPQHDISYRIRISNCRLTRPSIHNDATRLDEPVMPKDCIEREMTYGATFRATVEVFLEGTLQPRLRESLPPEDVAFMTIPVPVGSRFCNTRMDGGPGAFHPDVFRLRGCFIVKGQKKNIICFESAATNLAVLLHSAEDGYYSEIRSHSKPVRQFDVTLMAYSNVVKMKKHVLLFQSRTFKSCNSTRAVTLVNVLTNLGLHSYEALRDALLGMDPDPELEEAMAMTLANPDDFPLPLTPEAIRANFGAPPLSLGSNLGRRATASHAPPTFRTERHAAWAESILEREILPHCGTDNAAKIYILCAMARRVALSTYRAERGVEVSVDNRDDLCNKYIKGYADLIQELTLEGMKVVREKVHKDVRDAEKAQKGAGPLTRQTFPSVSGLPWMNADAMKTISNGQISSRPRGKLSKGPVRKGLTQTYGGMNMMYDIACLRNFKNPVNKQSKSESIRQIQASSYGYYCPSETREGQDVGLDHALALQASTSLLGSVEAVDTILTQFDGVVPLQLPVNPAVHHVVFINGMPVYCVAADLAEGLVAHLRDARRKGLLHLHTSVTHGAPFEHGRFEPEIHVRCNAGRLMAAHLTVENDAPVLMQRFGTAMVLKQQAVGAADLDALRPIVDFAFDDLFLPLTIHFHGRVYEFPAAVEWIDVFECKNILLSEYMTRLRPGSTHAMIHPSLLLGSSASEVPFPDHNQSPRNAYQCGMGKQSIAGRPLTTTNESNIPPYLLYPQMPLVSTEYSKMILEKHPCPTGFNGIVAIMSRGRNQEDAIILNRDSIQRGMGVSLHEELYSDTAKNTGLHYESGLSQADKFAFPDPEKVCNGFVTHRRFDHIDENGLAIVGSVVSDGDPLICKLRKFQAKHECITTKMRGGVCRCEYACSPTCYSGNDLAVVDRVQVTTNAQGDKMVNVVVRYIRTPACGDKLASRHGQKGTIGAIVAREDLPFSARDGISPDIIINPHAIPSRMTVAHLIETLAGAFTCVSGVSVDATPFSEDSQQRWTAQNLAKELKKYGYDPYCEESMICGMTGEPIECKVFMGPIFYQRMKQMPIDKAHARATGQVTMSTRQPREGRSKKGGFRCGEMERDCLTSHGASAVVQERFMHSSDPYKIYVCDVCHRPCVGNADERRRVFRCTTCGNTDVAKMSVVQMPYAGKLLNQEITGLRVAIDIVTENAVAIGADEA